ncbi:MAG: helix-turn-helix transcriptional regulator [Clostridia bacterium]|nr:helix-turn-helix transcriptional regulator [Clostridia bacterium]
MKNKEQFNGIVAHNIAKYRKFNNLTQLALAEKLNYSDKAVAKWESGESLPDAFVLYQIASIFGITLNDLLSERKGVKMPSTKIKSIIVPTLANCIVWLVALLAFITLSAVFDGAVRSWLAFIVAIPVTFILFLIFGCVYKNTLLQFISISCLIWSTILTVYLFLVGIFKIANYLYFIGIPIQIAFIIKYAVLFAPFLNKLKKKTKS